MARFDPWGPQSGKTTIFNALTRGNTPTTASAGRFEVHTAVVEVPDPRVTKLSEMFKPKKTVGQMVEEAKGTARDEGNREKAAAKAEIEQEVSRAREMLRDLGK